jgi:hypothetical protein
MTSARRNRNRALAHPSFPDELLDDLGYGTALKPRAAGKIGPGKRLVFANQFQNNIPVNAASGVVGRRLHLGKIDVPYACLVLHFTFPIRLPFRPAGASPLHPHISAWKSAD